MALVPSCVQVLGREGVAYRPLRGGGPRAEIETGAAWRADDDAPTVRAFVDLLPRA